MIKNKRVQRQIRYAISTNRQGTGTQICEPEEDDATNQSWSGGGAWPPPPRQRPRPRNPPSRPAGRRCRAPATTDDDRGSCLLASAGYRPGRRDLARGTLSGSGARRRAARRLGATGLVVGSTEARGQVGLRRKETGRNGSRCIFRRLVRHLERFFFPLRSKVPKHPHTEMWDPRQSLGGEK
jgi:hypothetical protein